VSWRTCRPDRRPAHRSRARFTRDQSAPGGSAPAKFGSAPPRDQGAARQSPASRFLAGPQRLGCGAVRRPARRRECRARGRRARPRSPPAALAGRPGRRRAAGTRSAGHGGGVRAQPRGRPAAGPAVPSTVTYVPVWSTTIGAVLLAEPVGWNTVVGVSWWLLGSSSPASPTGPEGGGCATGPAPRSRSVSFGAPCRAFVTPDGIVRA